MPELKPFVYAIRPSPRIGRARFESTLVRNVLGDAESARGRNQLVKLPALNGHGNEYLLVVGPDPGSGLAAAPDAEQLNARLQPHGTVEPFHGPFASVEVDLAGKRAIIRPNLLEIFKDERMIWSFQSVPLHQRPFIDFFSYQPKGSGGFTAEFQPPFEELISGSSSITTGKVIGPPGRYWYEVSLASSRLAGIAATEDSVVRLKCDPWPDVQPGKGRTAAAIEISDPPPR